MPVRYACMYVCLIGILEDGELIRVYTDTLIEMHGMGMEGRPDRALLEGVDEDSDGDGLNPGPSRS